MKAIKAGANAYFEGPLSDEILKETFKKGPDAR